MAEQGIEYGKLVENALRGVVREALRLVAGHGLPGQHHVYVTFRTDHPGVVLGASLRARYPAEMTIVLQHEFWALEVDEDAFAVTLKSGGAPERLRVPFAAVSVFADPSVEFGLQFSAPAAPTEAAAGPAPRARPEGPRPGASGARKRASSPPAPVAELPRPAARPEGKEGSGEVVTLDRFRKK